MRRGSSRLITSRGLGDEPEVAIVDAVRLEGLAYPALGLVRGDLVERRGVELAGREHVTPDDVRAIVHDCLRHRLILSYEANAAGVTANQVIDELISNVAVA